MSYGGAAQVARNAPSETTPKRGPRKSRGPCDVWWRRLVASLVEMLEIFSWRVVRSFFCIIILCYCYYHVRFACHFHTVVHVSCDDHLLFVLLC